MTRGRQGGGRAAAWAAVLLVVGAARAEEPDTLRVPEDYSELRRALAAARDGDVVQVAPGRLQIEPLVLARAVTLRGAGPGRTVLSGDPSRGALLYLGAGATVQGLTLEATPGEGPPQPLVTVAHARGVVSLRDLVLERAPDVGLMIFAGAVRVEGLEVRSPGGNGVEVRRLQGDGDVFVPWPRPELRGLVVREAGGVGVLLADGAGGLLERPLVVGSRGGADVEVSDPLTCTRVVPGDAPLRVRYASGAEPAQPWQEARSRAEEAAERASCADGEAAQAQLEAATLLARGEIARLTRAGRAGLEAAELGPHLAALTAFAEGLAACWAQPGIARPLLIEALGCEVASCLRRRGPAALVEWLLSAPAPPAGVSVGSWYLGRLGPEERAAFTAAWLELRRARFEPLLAPLRGREQADPDLEQAARELAGAIAAVHSARHPLEQPPAPEAAASHGALGELVEGFVRRNGGAPAASALVAAAGDPAGGGSAGAAEVALQLLSRERRRELQAFERAYPQRAAREREARLARLAARQQRLEQELTAAGADPERIGAAVRACLLDLGAEAKDSASQGEPYAAARALAERLLRERGPELYAAVYRDLPEQLGPRLARDPVLLGFLKPPEQLDVLRAAWRDEPWRVGERLPPLQVPRQHATIQAAIEAAEPGQQIEVAGGSYPERLRLRPWTRLVGGQGARLIHDYDTAVLIRDCPGVRMVGFTIEPAQRREPRTAPGLGRAEAALVRVERSEVTLGLNVYVAGPNWAISLVDSQGVLRQGRIATGDFGGLRVDGPRSRVRLEQVEVVMAAGQLLAVTGGAEVELVGCQLRPDRREVGVLVTGAGSRISVAEEQLPLLRFEGGASPTPEQAGALGTLEAARLEARRAALQAWREASTRVPAETEANVRRNRVGLHLETLRRQQGYAGYDVIRLEAGKALAAPLARCLEALGRSAARDLDDMAEVRRLIAAEARAFHQRYGVVPYAELLDAYQPPSEGREPRAVEADRERLREVLDADERDYVAARGRWLRRAEERARSGGGREEPEPWPTRWQRQQVGGLPVSALFPGEATPGKPEDQDGQGVEQRLHLHAGTTFAVIGEARPLIPAGEPAPAARLDALLGETLQAGWPGAIEAGAAVLERGLPEPYLRCGWRPFQVQREGAQAPVHVISAWAHLRDRQGAVWQVQLVILTQGGDFADRELRQRFLHSLRLER